MKFNKYEDINLFWKDNQKLLEEKEWYNCLIIGNCLYGIEHGMDNWLLATIENNNKTELIVFYRKPWKLVMYSPTNNYSDDLLKFATNELYKYDKKILGVNAEKEVANAFAKYYCEISSMKYKEHMPLRILVLEKIEKGNLLEDVIFRKAVVSDKEILIQYIKNFMKDALNEECSDEDAEEKFKRYFKQGYYVLEEDKKIVAQAVLSRNMKHGKAISAVYTPKEERSKGYAYNLVYRLSKQLLEDGNKYCVLYTDDGNPISNHIYEKIGYRQKSEWKEINFE